MAGESEDTGGYLEARALPAPPGYKEKLKEKKRGTKDKDRKHQKPRFPQSAILPKNGQHLVISTVC